MAVQSFGTYLGTISQENPVDCSKWTVVVATDNLQRIPQNTVLLVGGLEFSVRIQPVKWIHGLVYTPRDLPPPVLKHSRPNPSSSEDSSKEASETDNEDDEVITVSKRVIREICKGISFDTLPQQLRELVEGVTVAGMVTGETAAGGDTVQELQTLPAQLDNTTVATQDQGTESHKKSEVLESQDKETMGSDRTVAAAGVGFDVPHISQASLVATQQTSGIETQGIEHTTNLEISQEETAAHLGNEMRIEWGTQERQSLANEEEINQPGILPITPQNQHKFQRVTILRHTEKEGQHTPRATSTIGNSGSSTNSANSGQTLEEIRAVCRIKRRKRNQRASHMAGPSKKNKEEERAVARKNSEGVYEVRISQEHSLNLSSALGLNQNEVQQVAREDNLQRADEMNKVTEQDINDEDFSDQEYRFDLDSEDELDSDFE